MKKILLYSSVAIIVMAACSKEKADNSNNLSNDKATYQFTISANASEMESNGSNQAQISTKTSYAGETTFSWTLGDQISVLFHDAGDNNAFYTLTATSVDGKNATFTGTIDSGWEVGAADTGDKWALFPAGSHSYTATAPVFNLAASTDFSTSHFSANLPLYAIGEDNGAGTDVYAFKHISNVGAYKFTFNDIDVSKVRLDIETSGSYHISGDFQLAQDGSNYKINPWTYSFDSEAGKRVSFTENVVSKTATFYVPFKTWENNFTPTMTLYDANTGFVIKTVTASTNLPYTTGNVIVAKPFSAPGTGSALVSSYGINWSAITCEAAGSTGDGVDAIQKIKAVADADFVYVYMEINNNRLYSNPSYKYQNRSYLYVGDGTAGTASKWTQDYQLKLEGWLKYNNVPDYTANTSGILDGNRGHGSIVGDVLYLEMAIKRSGVACLQNAVASNAYVGFMTTDTYNVSGSSTEGSRAEHGFAPVKNGSMLEVAVPAYVAAP